MSSLLPCPQCASPDSDEGQTLLLCPECADEWSLAGAPAPDVRLIRVANGNLQADGDAVTEIKDLELTRSSLAYRI